MTPLAAARRLEKQHHVTGSGGVERFAGYGLLGVAFESGHVLALTRFTASSIGPPYAAIWLRDPQLRWTFFTSVEPARSCPRYFGPALHDVRVEEIEIGWRSDYEVIVSARRSRVFAALRLRSTPLTRALGIASASVPDTIWQRERERPLLGRIAGSLLDAGVVELAGRTPSGHSYLMKPRRLWHIRAAACVLGGVDAGSLATALVQPSLGEFMLPRHALFAAGSVTFERQA